jgi:ubiquinone biosynthesis protein COQ9
VLYWLGDESDGHQNSWEFLDRRIDNVMQFEKLKAGLKKNPLLKGPLSALESIRAPQARNDLPGQTDNA